MTQGLLPHLLREHLAHTRAISPIKALGCADDGGVRRGVPLSKALQVLPERCGGDADDDDVRIGDGLTHMRCDAEVGRERETSEAVEVLAGVIHPLRRFLGARPTEGYLRRRARG